MLHWRGTQLVAQRFVNGNAVFTIITKDADFNQVMALDCNFSLFDHTGGESIVTNHHNRAEVVGFGFKRFALGGGDDECSHASIIEHCCL